MKIGKSNKLVCNLYDKTKLFYSHRKLKTSIKPWIGSKKST